VSGPEVQARVASRPKPSDGAPSACRRESAKSKVKIRPPPVSLPGELSDVLWRGNDVLLVTSWGSPTYTIVALDCSPSSVIALPQGCDVLYKRISPAAKTVAFTMGFHTPEWGKLYGLFTADLDTGKVRRILETPVKTAPAWSPDSRRVAVADSGGYGTKYPLVIIEVDTGEVRGTEVEGVGASWSPDGDYLAFTTEVVGGGSWMCGVPQDGRIGIWNVKTGELTHVTPPGRNESERGTRRWEYEGFRTPVWSPAGDHRLVCTRIHLKRSDESKESESEEVWITDLKTAQARKLLDDAPPVAWAPDGRVLYALRKQSLVKIDLDSMKTATIASWDWAFSGGSAPGESRGDGRK
jgi:dipeptidyl aminopeptidase/acylaminoacyl peptidase